MSDETGMREQLVGYVLGALDDDERREVEAVLADERGAGLRRDLELVRSAVAPLAHDRSIETAPTGLAARTLAFVAAHGSAEPRAEIRPLSPAADEARPRGRAWLDRALMAATALAACVLLLPLLGRAVDDARKVRPKYNLQRLGVAVQEYGNSHGYLPTPPSNGPLARAGLVAPTLVAEERIRTDDGMLLVPGSALSKRGDFLVPTFLDLGHAKAHDPARFDVLVREMSGDYGYTLGHRDATGVLRLNPNSRRADHPIVADDPDHTNEKSDNHPEGIHHLLFEDGHVECRKAGELHHGGDHLYLNDDGEVAAGDDPDDAVIGDSEDKP